MKKLFAMFLALTMTFQLITPAWADAATEEPEEVTEASEVVEEVEPEEDVLEEIPEETTEPTVPEEPQEETTLPTEAEEYRVSFVCTPEDLTLVVYPKDTDIDQAIEPEEDGTYLLKAGEYAYLAAAEGYESKQSTISVTGNTEKIEIVLLSTLDSGAVSEYTSDCAHGNLTFFEGYPATMQYNGTRAAWHCTDCGKYFRDDNGQPGKELTEADSIGEESDYGSIEPFLVIPRLPLVSSGTTSDGFTWSIDDEGVLRISGIGNMRNYAEDSGNYGTRNQIPEWYQYQRMAKTQIRKLILSDGITSIGKWAFCGMSCLTEVCLPDTLTEINFAAFRDCRDLENVNITKNVAKIGAYAFEACKSLTSIVIPHGVPEIEVSAFTRCTNLKDIYIPQSVTNIDMAFSYAGSTGTEIHDVYYEGTAEDWAKVSGRSQLSDATIHYEAHIHSLTHNQRKEAACDECGSPEYWHCEGCQKNFGEAECVNELQEEQLVFPALGHDLTKTEAVAPTYTAPGNNEYYTCARCGKVFKDADGKTETTVDAETLEQLPSIAYGTCGYGVNWVLTEDGTLTISGSGDVTYYSSSNAAPWYKYRKNVINVVVEPGVTSLGAYAFYGCYKLETVTFGTGMGSIGSFAFRDCKNLTTVNIADGLRRIDGYAFYGCSGLTGINLPKGVAIIGEYAFADCSNLAYITLQEGLESIGGNAFRECSSLTSIYIPEGLTSIGWDAFENCSSLASVSLPETATDIGSSVFSGCRSLTSINIPQNLTTIWGHTFSGCSSLTNIDIPESVTGIGSYAFSGCSGLTNIVLPEGLVSIEDGVFSGCTGLKSVDIPKDVTSIGSYAFSGCSGLTSVTIPEGVASIENGTFYGCSGLTSVTIPEGVTSIGQDAFYGCSSLTSVAIPEGVTNIEYRTFYGCNGLTSMTIPKGVTSIGSYAFSGCSGLTSITIPEGVTSIGSYAFEGCSGLTSVTIPEGVTSIEYRTFYGCSGLTSVTIPEGVTSIGEDAFYNCSNLTSVTIPESVMSVGCYAFQSCSSLTSVYIPKTVQTIEHMAFYDCGALKDVYYSGTDIDWLQITIGYNNYCLTDATIHYNSIHICELVPTPAKAPTCTESGNNAYYTCQLCQKVYQDEQGLQETTVEAETLPALGHSMEQTAAKAATCTEDGNDEYFTCATCHKIFKDAQGDRETTVAAEIIPALGHAMVRVETTAPTCTGKGNRVYYRCETCSKSFKDKAGLEATTPEAEAVAALGHTMVKTEAVAPTCTVSGSNAYYTCDTCHKVFKDAAGKQETTPYAEILAPLGHAMKQTAAKAATCTEPGNNLYYTCITCGIVFQDEKGEQQTTVDAETIPALGHTMEETPAVAPTCTEGGNNAYFTCETCHKIYKDAEGKRETTVKAETLAALGHHMILTAAVAPTCTESGNRAYYTCSTCQGVYKDWSGSEATTAEAEVLPALGHRMTETPAKAATCTTSGNNAYFTCATCHKIYKDADGRQETTKEAEVLPALGHTMTETAAKEATCTESGNNAYFTCETCHLVFKDAEGKQKTTVAAETLKALGHKMTKTAAKAATCTEDGNNVYFTCATCHKVYKDQQGTQETTVQAETLKALGHSMTATPAKAATCTESGNNAYFTCGTCHKVYKDRLGTQETTVKEETLPALGHTMAKTEAKEPTCTEDGTNAYYTCATCHQVFKDELGQRRTTVSAEKLSAFGHTMKQTAPKEATCTESGNHLYYTCITCGIVFQDEEGEKQTTVDAETIPALGHTMEETPAVAPTCTEGGNNAYFTCDTCHKVYQDAEGKQETTVKAETLAPLGHTMVKTDALAPTCTESGTNAYYTCDTCHKVYKDADGKQETDVEAEILAPTGHKMEAVEAKDPTCTETGNHAYYLCANCGKAYLDEQGEKETTVDAETIPALSHTMEETPAVAPTCTEGGNNAYFTCATCHKVYQDAEGKQETSVEAETLAPLGHTMIETPAVEPTHTSGGNNAYYTCSVCHKVFKDVDGQTETTVEAEQLPRLPGLAHGTSGSLTWFLSEEEVLTVSGNGRIPDYSGNDLAPWYAFRGKIQKVILEEGVQTVGSYAFFDCNMLTEVELPQSVAKLGKSCFDGCSQLKLLSLDKVPGELAQKVTDLNGLAILAEPISSLVGNRAAYHWSLETIRGEDQASTLAKLDGTKLEVIHSGKFYLVCEEDYTGLSAAIEVGVKTSTEIRPDTEQLTGGESLTLTAWAMPFDTELSANWTLTKESEVYASITTYGTLTAKAVTAPVQITVKAEPVNGEEAAEKTLWILPKTTGLGILADGHLTGETLTVDLTETRELTLSAQIQPQGAGTKVVWTSSREDVATVDPDGKVLLLKPGKTLIRAETQDGSGIATELTLTVRYLDSAEELTLTAQIPETGLEPGMTAKLTLSGENAIDPEKVEFYIPASQSAIATVDETGLLTAGTTPGTVTVTAALKDDPLMRKAQLTLTVNPMLNHALRLESSIPDGLGYVDGNMFYGEIAGIAGQNRSFALKVQGQDYLGNWAEAKNVTYASSNPAIAAVDASGTVSLTAKEEGTCLITVRCTDALEAEAQLTVVLQNSAPRLGANTVTLNSNSTRGATVDLVASYGNTVDTVTVYDYNKSTKTYALSTMFTAEAEDGTLTLYSQGVLKNGTYPVKLEVACRTGVYTFTMNVKVANATPKVTVKQTAKLNLFYKDSTAPLTVTAPGQTVTDVELTDTGDFTLMSNGEDWEIVYISENAKPDTKGTLNVYLEGYQAPVQVNLTVGTVTTAPAIKLSATSSTLNTALNSDLTTKVTLLDKSGQPLELENPTVDCSSADVSVKGSLLTITLDAPKSATVTMELQDSTWAQSVKLTHKVAVSEKLPTLKPAGTLTLNSLFAKGTAETGMILSQGNLTLVNVEATPAAKEGTPALAESEKLRITYDPETGHMVASIKDAPKAGTYSFNCTGTLEDGTQIPGGTLRVTVSATAPKVKLSAASVKLNKFLAGAEQGSVTVTVPTGYQVVDFTGKSDSMTYDADTGILTVALEDASDNGGNYTLYPVVRDVETGEEVELPTKLSFKVQTYNSQKLSVSLSAKGKLDTQTDSEILYTVTKLTGCLGTVDNVILEGQDKDLFRADMDVVNGKTTVHLTLVDGVTYATNKAYKVQFRFYACGTEILSPVQTVKVTQTALKVTAPKNITYYQAQKSPLRVVLTTNVPLDEVVLNDKTAKEFRAAVGEVTLNGNRVEFEITNPAALTAGKSYSVALDATPENNAENAKPVAVRLTVKVQK